MWEVLAMQAAAAGLEAAALVAPCLYSACLVHQHAWQCLCCAHTADCCCAPYGTDDTTPLLLLHGDVQPARSPHQPVAIKLRQYGAVLP